MFKQDGSRKDFKVDPERRYIIGRNERADLRIPLSSVSREHAAVFFDPEEDELVIEDLGSANGTWVNNERIDENVELCPGDIVAIGDVPFQIVIDGFPKEVEPIHIVGADGKVKDTSSADSVSESQPSADNAEPTQPATDKETETKSDDNIDSFFGFDLDDDDI